METTSILLKYLVVIAIVATFSWFVTQSDPTGPQLVGWSAIQNLFSHPFAGFTAFQGNWANQNACAGYDVGCWLSNLVNLFVGIATNVVAVFSWFVGAVFSVGTGLFGVTTLTFSPPLPQMVQVVIWAIVAPFWFLVATFIFGMIRGNK